MQVCPFLSCFSILQFCQIVNFHTYSLYSMTHVSNCQQHFLSFYNVADWALESENVQQISVRSKKVLVCVSFSPVKTLESSLANISSKLKYTMEDSNHTFGRNIKSGMRCERPNSPVVV